MWNNILLYIGIMSSMKGILAHSLSSFGEYIMMVNLEPEECLFEMEIWLLDEMVMET